MKVVFYGDYAIKEIRAIYEAAGWKCDQYQATNGRKTAKVRELLKLLSADYIYIVSGCDVKTTFAYRLALKLKKKVIVHWIGTDVLRIREAYYKNPRKINEECINLADAPWLVDELEEVGIAAVEVPIANLDICCKCDELPDNHEILVYIPKHRAAFYNEPVVKQLAKAVPDVLFHIVGNDGEDENDKLPNLVYEGWLNSEQMRELMKKCTVLIRLPQHDGVARMVLEVLSMGRSVIYNYPFPFTKRPKSDNIEDILEILNGILSEKPYIDYEAQEFISSNYTREKIIEKYRAYGLI